MNEKTNTEMRRIGKMCDAASERVNKAEAAVNKATEEWELARRKHEALKAAYNAMMCS